MKRPMRIPASPRLSRYHRTDLPQAHVCVSTTTRQAHEKGWDTIVVEDCVGDRDIPGTTGPELTRVVLAELADFFATVVHSKDIV